MEFVETPLKDALQFLQDQTQVPFYIKGKKLEDAGVTLDQAITCNLKQVRLSTFLDLKLEEFGLVYYDKDGLLVITTPDDAEATLEIRVYDCRDLLAMPEPVSGARPGGGGRPGARSNGSPYATTPAPPGAVPSRARLQALILSRRRTPPRGVPGPVPGSAVPPPHAAHAARRSAAARSRPVCPCCCRAFAAPRRSAAVRPPDVLAQGFGGGGFGEATPPKPLSEHEQRAQRLIELITTSVNPQSWTEMGGAGSISEYHGLIVVTQTAQTHKKVEHVLNMLRQAADLERAAGASREVSPPTRRGP